MTALHELDLEWLTLTTEDHKHGIDRQEGKWTSLKISLKDWIYVTLLWKQIYKRQKEDVWKNAYGEEAALKQAKQLTFIREVTNCRFR